MHDVVAIIKKKLYVQFHLRTKGQDTNTPLVPVLSQHVRPQATVAVFLCAPARPKAPQEEIPPACKYILLTPEGALIKERAK